MTSPLNREKLRDKCVEIQLLTKLDDNAWKRRFGNDEGLYGFIDQYSQQVAIEARIAELIQARAHKNELLVEHNALSYSLDNRIAELQEERKRLALNVKSLHRNKTV